MPEPQSIKRMSLVQLTFMVAVNMMGSGIIMLPTNMAKVGAISLLSWIVTALGSMAIAYGFAQAGLFNQRPGGMSAYAEDAYGKPGYFLVFFLYFLSLAIGNVAIAISAVGYLASLLPGCRRPVATCIGVIALLWLTTVANFGGPGITGRIGAVTVWGVIIPVAGLSLIGWFWFKPEVCGGMEPKGMSLLEGMRFEHRVDPVGFLDGVGGAEFCCGENQKRDVPLACMFGTLGAGVVCVLSTTVIQGIVPNQECGAIDRAVRRCLRPHVQPGGRLDHHGARGARLPGSLLGWQFTIATTGKAPPTSGCSPPCSRVNSLGAPIVGMVRARRCNRAGLVDDLAKPQRAVLSAGEPRRRHQRGALRHLAVGADGDDAGGRRHRRPVPPQRRGCAGRDALQCLCDLCLRQGRGARRHAGDRSHLRDLGLYRAAFHGSPHGGR
jgi:putrescine:ornithine antiporter